jgi:hypothetical protein
MRRRRLEPAPILLVGVVAALLTLLAVVGLLTDLLGSVQLLTIATLLTTTMILILGWIERGKL